MWDDLVRLRFNALKLSGIKFLKNFSGKFQEENGVRE
jgi:hypothetical protein